MRFHPGQRVRVAARPHVGHHRVPAYVKGKIGRVECARGPFRNPETLAYGKQGLPAQRLYTVSFDQRDVWSAYGGCTGDRIWIDLYEHWLEDVQ